MVPAPDAYSAKIMIWQLSRDAARRFGAALCLPALLLSGCAMGGDPPAATTTGTIPMQQRFIVRYVPGSAPERDPSLVADRIAQSAGAAGVVDAKGLPGKVTWLRRLAVGADVVSIDPALDAVQARRLLDALGAEPDIEYAEPDGHMTIGPGPALPARVRSGG